jgi:hypothetical protein
MAADEYSIRSAGLQDAAIIAAHRAAMFRDMGELSPAEHDVLLKATEP